MTGVQTCALPISVMRSAKTGYGEEAAADEPLDFKTIKLQYNVQAKFVLE